MRTLLVTQARFNSSRFPGKILRKIGNKSLLQIHLERLKRSKMMDGFLVATTEEPEADVIVQTAKSVGFETYRGSLLDVLDRFYQGCVPFSPEIVVRVTSDCPLNDGLLIDEMLAAFELKNCDYLSNTLSPTFPDGLDVEIFKFSALARAWAESKEYAEREHVTPYIYRRPNIFGIENFAHNRNLSKLRLTLDYPEDLLLLSELIRLLGDDKPWLNYVSAIEANPSLCKFNQHFSRNAFLGEKYETHH